MTPQPTVMFNEPHPPLSSDHEGMAKQLARTLELIEASHQLRTVASSLRGEADNLRAHARVIRHR